MCGVFMGAVAENGDERWRGGEGSGAAAALLFSVCGVERLCTLETSRCFLFATHTHTHPHTHTYIHTHTRVLYLSLCSFPWWGQ